MLNVQFNNGSLTASPDATICLLLLFPTIWKRWNDLRTEFPYSRKCKACYNAIAGMSEGNYNISAKTVNTEHSFKNLRQYTF